ARASAGHAWVTITTGADAESAAAAGDSPAEPAAPLSTPARAGTDLAASRHGHSGGMPGSSIAQPAATGTSYSPAMSTTAEMRRGLPVPRSPPTSTNRPAPPDAAARAARSRAPPPPPPAIRPPPAQQHASPPHYL